MKWNIVILSSSIVSSDWLESFACLTATQIHDELTTAYGQGVVSYRTVAHWIHRFSSGRESLEDDSRSDRPIAIITQQNIDAVKDLVQDDPHISTDYTADILDISHGSVYIILKEHLKLKKISSRWVPHKLTPTQQQRHMNDIVFKYLQEEKIKVMAHPPYSPDLASSDFWLFRLLVVQLSET
ncbi:unnamed protein product [Rotaria sp. Silwood1]|nr:unnamed protein product [Rotaria sp. Silwood1]CAF1643478.1 unnamed protein product [Rotaria sp. Silwood1]